MKAVRAETVRQAVVDVGRAGLGVEAYVEEVLDLLALAVPYDAVCLGASDPATGLMTRTYKRHLHNRLDGEFSHFEYEVPDALQFIDLMNRPEPVGVLSQATGGDPRASARYRDFLEPHFGIGHEMRASLRAGEEVESGTWGHLALFRDPAGSDFSPAEADFIARLTAAMAEGMRAAVVTSTASVDRASVAGPAVLVIGAGGTVVSATPAARERLAQIGVEDGGGDMPMAMKSLVATTRGFRAGHAAAAPRARVRTRDGVWLVLHGAPLSASGDPTAGDIVVTIEEAGPPDVVPLLVAALGLTARERDVVHLVLSGADTAEIGKRLHLSPYTVQDHLKAVFAKAGVRSRRELTAKVFFDHYAPRADAPLAPSGWFVE